jgi:3'-phosphoadenosine 5'-phosphosulfate sulfotransferase (PAPS reductase)/FAD synthetase
MHDHEEHLTYDQYQMRVAMPLDLKIAFSKRRITSWHNDFGGMIYISDSGGQDSDVLRHLTLSLYPNTPIVHFHSGTEAPEVYDHLKNLDLPIHYERARKNFRDVIETYGYPVISKTTAKKIFELRHTESPRTKRRILYGIEREGRAAVRDPSKLPEKWKFLLDAPFAISHYCCNVLRKEPAMRYHDATGRVPMVGILAEESNMRKMEYINHGCLLYHLKIPMAKPLSFWTSADIKAYHELYGLGRAKIYDLGWTRTGCMGCGFGCMHDGSPNRFQRMKNTHPTLWKFYVETCNWKQVLDYIHLPYE